MKRSTIFLSSLIAIIAVSSYGQIAGSSGTTQSGAKSGAVQQGTAGQNTTQANPAQPPGETLAPGLEKRDELPPGLQNRNQLPPGLAARTNQFGRPLPPIASSNRFGVTTSNQFGVTASNQFGTKVAGLTNQFGIRDTFAAGVSNRTALTPTSQAGATNRVFSGTNITAITQDQAFTPADQQLLTQIRQTVASQLPTGTVGIVAPVHYIVREGVVTLVGFLPTAAERQQLVAIVQGIPGVVGVIDQIQVGGGAAVSPTGVGVNASLTNQFGVRPTPFATNLSPTARSNALNRIFGSNVPPQVTPPTPLPPQTNP